MITLLAFIRALTGLLEALTPLIREMVHDRIEARRAAPHARLVAALAAGDADAVAAAYDELDELLSRAGIAIDSPGGVGSEPEPRRVVAGVERVDGAQRQPHPCAADPLP